jgi:hypothetical protein
MAHCKRTSNANKFAVCNDTRQNERLNESSAHYDCTSLGASQIKLSRANKGRVLKRNDEEHPNDKKKNVCFDEPNTGLYDTDESNAKLARKDQVKGLKNPNKEHRDNERCTVYCDGLRSPTPPSHNRYGRVPLGKSCTVSNEMEIKKHQHGRQVLYENYKPESMKVNLSAENESLNHRKKTYPQHKGRSAAFHDSRVAISETVWQRQQVEEKCFNEISSILKPSTYQKGKELRDDRSSGFDAVDGVSVGHARCPSGPGMLDSSWGTVEKSGTATEDEKMNQHEHQVLEMRSNTAEIKATSSQLMSRHDEAAFQLGKAIDDLTFGLLTLPCMP